MKFREFASIKDMENNMSVTFAFISAFRSENSNKLNEQMNKNLAKDIDTVGYQYIPIVGSSDETDSSGQKHHVWEKSFFISAKAVIQKEFVNQIVFWLNKYYQEYALVRFAHDETTWKIFATGNQEKYGVWAPQVKWFHLR